MRKSALAPILAFILGAGPAYAALGDLPLTNTAQTTSIVNLNFTSAGTHQQVALILINSNDPAGFHVTFTFQNKGFFTVGARQFAMSNIVLNKVSGTIGGGLVDPANTAMTLDGAGSWTWSPGVPTSETDNLLLEIAVDWADPSARLAGFYQERITCTIASGP
jgi:hypothetical protein